VFAGFPVPVAGKTGTAEKVVDLPGYRGLMDQSWFCASAPADSPEITACAVIENGGHGGTAAAPTVQRLFSHYFKVEPPAIGAIHSD
jgi:penicillin-binding protein 2